MGFPAQTFGLVHKYVPCALTTWCKVVRKHTATAKSMYIAAENVRDSIGVVTTSAVAQPGLEYIRRGHQNRVTTQAIKYKRHAH